LNTFTSAEVSALQALTALANSGAGFAIAKTGASTFANVATGGGGGYTVLASTEIPDGIITVFTFASATAQPTFMLIDFAQKPAVNRDSSVNWTWAAGPKQATIAIPPYNDISAIV